MALSKRTYALPAETIDQFERVVQAGRRSAVVGQVLKDWLEKRRREHLRNALIEGCRDMATTYLEMEKEFHPLEEEVSRGLESAASKRRRRSSTPRSRRRV